MKKLFFLILLVGVCILASRSDALFEAMGQVHLVRRPDAEVAAAQICALPTPQGMTLTEYVELAKSDPEAYQKLFARKPQGEARSEIDKLKNFFSTLKYE